MFAIDDKRLSRGTYFSSPSSQKYKFSFSCSRLNTALKGFHKFLTTLLCDITWCCHFNITVTSFVFQLTADPFLSFPRVGILFARRKSHIHRLSSRWGNIFEVEMGTWDMPSFRYSFKYIVTSFLNLLACLLRLGCPWQTAAFNLLTCPFQRCLFWLSICHIFNFSTIFKKCVLSLLEGFFCKVTKMHIKHACILPLIIAWSNLW